MRYKEGLFLAVRVFKHGEGLPGEGERGELLGGVKRIRLSRWEEARGQEKAQMGCLPSVLRAES